MIIQLYFWNYLFQKLINYSPNSLKTKDEDLTILICVKNEIQNLKNLIPSLMNQAGSRKVLVVDDFSDDETASFLSACANKYPNFQSLHATKNIKGKKQALMDGLSQVKTKWVLLTDADSLPASDQWSSSMLSASRGKDIVLGFSPYQKQNGFLNRWIRYEAVLTAIQYLSYSLSGKTYMGVGRNLLYATSAVESGQSLQANIDLPSGDDDLLVNAIATKENVGINLDRTSWVYSQPKEKWSAYFNQKRRHLTTATRYKKHHQFLLLLFSISWIFLYVVVVVLFYLSQYKLAILLLGIRMLSTYWTNLNLFPKLGLKDCLAHWWYLDLCTAVYFLFFSIFAILPTKETW